MKDKDFCLYFKDEIYFNERNFMEGSLIRTEALFGKKNMDILFNSHIAIFGVGGVGSYVVESLVRTGIGKITMIDFDKVDISNINRQLPALISTVGKYKCDVMRERMLDIRDDITVNTFNLKYTKESNSVLNFTDFDYVVDCIDTVKSKTDLILTCKSLNIPIISSMGMANKLDPAKITEADIYKTHTCPLARIIRREMKLNNISSLDTVYSPEEPVKLSDNMKGSLSYVTGTAGLLIASIVIKNLITH